jgi:uncharacterized lipoprotein YddW (UPF0748 family)
MLNDLTVILVVTFITSPLAASQFPPPIPPTDYELFDDLSYSQEAAQKAWQLMTGSKNVSISDVAGKKVLRMPCNFRGTTIERASWDRQVKLDLTMCGGVQFLFYCRDVSAISHFSFYFHSGDGWYAGGFDAPASAGWGAVTIHKDATRVEGRPAGWDKIDTIRISAWRGGNTDTEFYITALGLSKTDKRIVVARGDSAADSAPSELKGVQQYADIMSELLDRAGLQHTVVSDLNLTAERLKETRLIILPFNPGMPDEIAKQIGEFIRTGGKLIVCYTLPGHLEPLVGIRQGQHIQQKYPGWFTSIRPSEQPLEGMPDKTDQASWNIQEASAVSGQSRVAAWWFNNEGESTQQAAIITSSNCTYLTHVLLADDPNNKLQLLLAMVGNLEPQLWNQAAQNRIDLTGQFGPYKNFDSARRNIELLAGTDNSALSVLKQARELREQALRLLAERKFSQAILKSEKARESMVEAYCLAQKPLGGEHRAFWCHSAFGVEGMTWDQAIKLLADNGFTAILPNMLWGGVAFYESDILPRAEAMREKGDQLRLCVEACKKYGIQCHIWKVNYNMGWATDKKFIGEMKAEGRTQINYDGSLNDSWLCPSHPANQKLEIESMLEIARKYDVHGLHFDYIRYPGDEGCFCSGCRQRFEGEIGAHVGNWPIDVRNSDRFREKWLDFRRRQITSVVAGVSGQAKQIKPTIKISAAVFRNWPTDRDSVGQDWKLWCDRGYLDFVCPMDYTPSSGAFQRMVEQQLAWSGKVPCYPGIGLGVWPDQTDVCKLIEQIGITRQLKTGGFTIFNYGPAQASEVLPMLGKGITRKTAGNP